MHARRARAAMRALLALLLVVPLVPAASAEQICSPDASVGASVCYLDAASADGSCAEGGSEFATTRATATADGVGSASAGGESYCSGASGANTIFVSAYTPIEGAAASWNEVYYSDPENGEFRQCFVSAGALFQPCPEALSPPNPGWGHLT